MDKKVILSWLSLVMLVITSAYVPVAAAAHISTPMIGPPNPPGPGGNGPSGNAPNGNGPGGNAASPQSSSQQDLRRIVGVVSDYSAGQSITIVDRQGNQFAFDLASPLKIVPTHRANLLGPGAFVTIIAPNNVPNGKHIAVGVVIHRGVPPGFAPPGGSGGVNQPTPGPIVNPPPVDTLVPGEPKPPLNFSEPVSPPLPPLGTTTGYSFPSDFVDWAMPIRVAAFETITIDPNVTFTPVGVVEIGSDQNSPRIYEVAIDLSSTGTEVQGQLLPITTTDTLDVTFQRMPQIPNPERTNSPYEDFQELEPAPDSFSTIFSGGVCFVATTADGPVKYCSTASASDESAQLSVRDNFSSQYANLQDLISPIAQQFGLENVIQLDQIISMQEDVQHIQDCASQLTQQACGADVVVAPVSEQSFEQQYNERFGGGDEDDEDDGDNGGDQSPTAFAVGVVKVLRPVDTSGDTIQPGDYRIDYWFDANGVFFAATLSGTMADNETQVTNQQVPAVPAALINAQNSPQQPPTQISACRIFRHCMFFQRTCG